MDSGYLVNYTIDENFTIRVYMDGGEIPVLEQPNYPDYSPFESLAEATAWADLFILSATDPDAPFAPAGPGLAGEPKPTERPEI